MHKTIRDGNNFRLLTEARNAGGYQLLSRSSVPSSASKMCERWMGQHDTNYHYGLHFTLLPCRIKCKCDYQAHIRAQHGLDGVKLSPDISDFVSDEDHISAEAIFIPYHDEAPVPGEGAQMKNMGLILDIISRMD